ncbi:tetraspanin-6-like [Centruroides sculpturatus]|uniref:tetraspanin-6-like n=1 Tax=Centruroides sculpturatus TaxID=218467 RepID=UPI000C6D52F7|nr:tetraspanin-6-like [Centruroides sculpturatus]
MEDSDESDNDSSNPRTILYISDILLLIGSNALLAIGIVAQSYIPNIEVFINDTVKLVPKAVIIMSIVISSVSVIYFGAIAKRSSRCMKICCLFLIMIFIGQLAIGVTIFLKRKEAELHIKNHLEETIKSYLSDENIKKKIDEFHTNNQCCGISNYTDWTRIYKYDDLPPSCCYGIGRRNCQLTDDEVFKIGCYIKIKNVLNTGIILTGIIIFLVCVLEILCSLYGFYYQKNMKDTSSESSESS